MSSPTDKSIPPRPVRVSAGARRLPLLLGVLLLIALVGGALRLSSHLNERSLASASLPELQNQAAQHPNEERVLFYLARRQEQNGQARDAMNSYNHALQLDQDDEAAWQGWARTTNITVGPAAAQDVVKTWLVRNPRSAAAYGMLAHLSGQSGDHLSAYNTAARAVSLAPGDGDLWQFMGAEAAALERPADSEAAFLHAIECNPTDWHSYAGISAAQIQLGRHPEGLASLREAVRLAPELGATHLLLGTELLNTAANDAEIEAARAELLQSAQKESRLPKSALMQMTTLLGDSYKRQHRWQEALGWYQKAADLNPLDPTVQYSLIAVYQGLGDKVSAGKAEARHRAIEAYDHELKVTVNHIQAVPDDLDARLKLARLYGSHGALPEAARTYADLLARSPHHPVARQELQSLLASRPTASP